MGNVGNGVACSADSSRLCKRSGGFLFGDALLCGWSNEQVNSQRYQNCASMIRARTRQALRGGSRGILQVLITAANAWILDFF